MNLFTIWTKAAYRMLFFILLNYCFVIPKYEAVFDKGTRLIGVG